MIKFKFPPYLLPSLAIFTLVAFLMFTLLRLFQLEQAMRAHVDENMLWVVTQAQVAGHRLSDDVHRFLHGARDADPALRLDILVSRMALLDDGPQRRYLKAMGLDGVLDDALVHLNDIEPVLHSLLIPPATDLVHASLDPLMIQLNRIANAVMVEEWETVGSRLDIYRRHMLQVIGLIIGILLSGLALVFLLIEALRQQHKAQNALALHRDKLEQQVKTRTRDLEAERQRVVAAIETAPDGFAAFDSNNRLVLINPQFSKLLPLSASSLTKGQHLDTLFKDLRKTARIEEPDEHTADFQQKGHMQCDLELAHQVWRQLTVRKTEDNGQVLRVADITRYKAAAHSLEHSLQLERGVSEFYRSFASMVSHQFRTPLSVIDSGLQRLLRRGHDMSPAEQKQRHQRMREAVAQMVRLIESSLTTARLDGGHVELSPDAHDMVELAEHCRRSFEKHDSRIHIKTDDIPQTVWCDRTLAEQVLSNLLSNAIKYSIADSVITIEVGKLENRVFCRIENQGIGINKRDLPRVFERFFRSHETSSMPGIGLGLNIARQLARIQKGDVTIESVEGEGTTATLWLPVEHVGGCHVIS